MLNTVKCTLASSVLLLLLLLQHGPSSLLLSMTNLGSSVYLPLLLSSFLGIIIGDLTWLAALKRLGSRRTILTDCARPVFAALIGFVFLGETLSLLSLAGFALATAGIALAVSSSSSSSSSPSSPPPSSSSSSPPPPSSSPQPSSSSSQASPFVGPAALGFTLALTHLILDTLGSALTKTASVGVGASTIVLVRFGFAASVLCSTCLAMRLGSSLRDKKLPASVDEGGGEWWELPRSIGVDGWVRISLGCLLVTVLAPTLFVTSLQHLPLGLALTLASLGPLYEQPLSYLLHRRQPSVAGLCGAAMAVCGVAMLCALKV